MGVKIAYAWENLLYNMNTASGHHILSYFNFLTLRAIFAAIFFNYMAGFKLKDQLTRCNVSQIRKTMAAAPQFYLFKDPTHRSR